MTRKIISIFFFALLYLEVNPVTAQTNDCINVSRDNSIWAQLGTEGVSVYISDIQNDSKKSQELPVHLRKYVFNNRPILSLDITSKKLVLDKNIFVSATMADATRLQQKTQLIAQLTQEGMNLVAQNKLSSKFLARLLIESEIVVTYWHLHASLCSQTSDDKISTKSDSFRFQGAHEYCTSECISAPLDFRITYHRKSGQFTLDKN